MTLTLEIEDTVQKSLERIASEKGKHVEQFVVEIIDDYVDKSVSERAEADDFARLAETSFDEWENDEDAIYDKL